MRLAAIWAAMFLLNTGSIWVFVFVIMWYVMVYIEQWVMDYVERNQIRFHR